MMKSLVVSRNISDETLEQIVAGHFKRFLICEEAKSYLFNLYGAGHDHFIDNLLIDQLSKNIVVDENDIIKITAEHDKKLVDNLRDLAKLHEANEFELQDLWGFSRDSSMHRWFEFPGCECPKMDNEERMGVPQAGRIISGCCPIHYHGDENVE